LEIELENKKLKDKKVIFKIEKITEILYLKENCSASNFINEVNILKYFKENQEKNEEKTDNENINNIINEYEIIINDLNKKNDYLEKELILIKNELNRKENVTKNVETDSNINISISPKLVSDNKLKDLKNKLIQKDIELKKVIEEKDRIINELINKNNLDDNNYIKQIKDLENKLYSTTIELNELKNKKDRSTIDGKVYEEVTSFEKQIDESKSTKDGFREEIKNYEKKIEELEKYLIKAQKADELEAKNNYLNNNIEILKKNIEELKNQNKKVKVELKEEIIRIQNDLGQIKFQLATTVYDKEMQSIRYRRYIDKLKEKLISLGYRFKEKHGKK
jgi:chromosome segregation ATPase